MAAKEKERETNRTDEKQSEGSNLSCFRLMRTLQFEEKKDRLRVDILLLFKKKSEKGTKIATFVEFTFFSINSPIVPLATSARTFSCPLATRKKSFVPVILGGAFTQLTKSRVTFFATRTFFPHTKNIFFHLKLGFENSKIRVKKSLPIQMKRMKQILKNPSAYVALALGIRRMELEEKGRALVKKCFENSVFNSDLFPP